MNLNRLLSPIIAGLGRVLHRVLRPTSSVANLVVGATGDMVRTRFELVAENALLRQQLIVMRRQIAQPRLHRDDRVLLLVLARLAPYWQAAMHLVSPDTLLRWHRDLFKIVWRRKSRPRRQPKRLAPETVSLIETMASDNVLWGAERIRGELLKLGLRISKRTIQKYMRMVRPSGKRGQSWPTFLRNL